jgi:hypothetical protein
MVEYSNEEILNELSTIFRGRIDSSRDAGLTDPIGTHEQIMELAKLVFLLNPGARSSTWLSWYVTRSTDW